MGRKFSLALRAASVVMAASIGPFLNVYIVKRENQILSGLHPPKTICIDKAEVSN